MFTHIFFSWKHKNAITFGILFAPYLNPVHVCIYLQFANYSHYCSIYCMYMRGLVFLLSKTHTHTHVWCVISVEWSNFEYIVLLLWCLVSCNLWRVCVIKRYKTTGSVKPCVRAMISFSFVIKLVHWGLTNYNSNIHPLFLHPKRIQL